MTEARRAAVPGPVDLILRGGTVVEADWQGAADVFVSSGVVTAVVEPGTPTPGTRSDVCEVDATGRLVVPGGVDPHCHVGFTSGEFTSLDDYYACTKAAVLGGTTTIVDFAIPRPGQRPDEVAYAQLAKADQGLCDSALHASVSEWDGSVPDQLRALAADGVTTVKMFTTYRGESMANADTILATMKALRPLGGMAVVHCEANHIIENTQHDCAAAGRIGAAHMAETRPELAETASVSEVLAIAESVRAPVYFVHQSTAAAVELVADARRRGQVAFSESVTHHLVLDDSRYEGPYPERYVCCPPLRPADRVAALGRHLFTGEISTIGSDHCCYDTAQKVQRRGDVREMPNGLPGVETRLTVIYSTYVAGRGLPMQRFVALTAANPARANGLYPRKGTLRPGSDADIAIWDPRVRRTVSAASLHMATDYTPYEGLDLTGSPTTVIVGGRVVVHDGEVVDPTPRGRFVAAGPVVAPVGL